MPCQHCKLNQELNTLKQQKNTLEDIPPSQRNYIWRNDWNKNNQQILKNEKQLTKISCNCEDWSVATPINNQPFTFDDLNEPTKWEQTFQEQQTQTDISNSQIVGDLVSKHERERERERERESNFNLNSIISKLN